MKGSALCVVLTVCLVFGFVVAESLTDLKKGSARGQQEVLGQEGWFGLAYMKEFTG